MNQNGENQLVMPGERGERDRVFAAVEKYAAQKRFVPPLALEELQTHSLAIADIFDIDRRYRNFIAVLINNEVWKETVGAIPYERRILLLPQCLRTKKACPARLDELGLLCEQCGACPTGELQDRAESLGYVTLVAEGTTVVTSLLEKGQIDAVIGVSCLAVLERSFPYLAREAIPGIAIPLHQNGCDDTKVDVDRILSAIHLKSESAWTGRLDLGAMRSTIDNWLEDRESLPITTKTEEIAYRWLSKSGKRWRPILCASVFKAFTGMDITRCPAIEKIAVAVECFHKASLIHDDIEDGSDFRYGEESLHRQQGMAIAVNAGDFLVGEGYRLITGCGAPPERLTRMLVVAAQGHRDLCMGQGEELCFSQNPFPLSVERVLHIFRHKTVPAFKVAILLGAVAAGATPEICRALGDFSEALGIAYQIRDDWQDSLEDAGAIAMKPSLFLALAQEKGESPGAVGPEITETVRHLFERYRREAIAALAPLTDAGLKTLLFRIAQKILGDGLPE